MLRRFTPFLLLLLILSACGGPSQNAEESKVLASTTFLADITQNIAGDRLVVQSLLPVGA